MFSNPQRGVSLIITFFIMIIILAVVLSISIILYSEVKVIRNVGNSVIAFYAADSGAEKVLYYDRKGGPAGIPQGAARGICNVCTSGVCPDCDCTPPLGTSGTDCTKCTDCEITFKTTMTATPQKFYNAVVNISTFPQERQCPLSIGNLESYGTYMNANRAINLNVTGDVKTGLGPGMGNPQVTISGNGKITISVTLSPYPDCKKDSVTAYIYDKSDGSLVDTLTLAASGQCDYSKPWQGQSGHTYDVSIGAIDANGYCASVTITPS